MQKWLISARNAWRGFILMIRVERNIRIELVIGSFVLAVALWLRIPWTEFSILLLCMAGVLTAEALNTAIEQLSDRITTETDSRIRDVKDIAAAGVLIMVVISVATGLIILGPRLYLFLT